ncbi:hypothetical protein DFP73DRAFT_353832 [Morchella snyderi]|nr:hypothetical protein DFP73DRAFT_353832 [Morchella snyderi]
MAHRRSLSECSLQSWVIRFSQLVIFGLWRFLLFLIMLYCYVEGIWGGGGGYDKSWQRQHEKREEKKRTKEQKNTKKRYCGVINLIFCGKVFLMRFSVLNEERQKGVGGFQQILTDLVGCHSGLSFSFLFISYLF